VAGVFGWWPVLVKGPSMVPALRSGDAVLARRGGRGVRPGDVVIARFPARPEIGLVVKRAVRPEPGGWWVEGDNSFVTGDSRAYGVAVVEARVVARYWPRPRLLRTSPKG
jgi:signal peptidase I